MHKTCARCGRTKSAIHFAMNSLSSDHLDSECRTCKSAYKRRTKYHKRYWDKRPEYRRKLTRQASQTPEGKARQIVRTAVYLGRMDKPDRCDLCGQRVQEARQLMAHHPDYDRRRDVVWVCRTCHGIIESISREAESALENYDPELGVQPWEADFVYPLTRFLAKWRWLDICEAEFFEFLRLYREALEDTEEPCDA